MKIFGFAVIIHTFLEINRKFAFFKECCYNVAVADPQQQFLMPKGFIMKTTELYQEQHLGTTHEAASDETETALIASAVCEALPVRISLWKGGVNGYGFYMIVSEWVDGKRETKAEILNTDRKTAERIYKMILRGAVPPRTLREVMFDLLP